MAFIPSTFPEPPPRATASFDFADIADGTGVRQFFLSSSKLSGSSTTYHLTQTADNPSEAELSGSTTSGAVFDADFDLTTFNFPQNIKGTAVANIVHAVSSGTGTITGYLRVFLRKWDGTTETEIASAVTGSISASPTTVTRIHRIPLEIPSVTHFKRGETLRLTVEGRISAVGGGVSTLGCRNRP